jgi:hypothetical protein
MDHSVKPQSVTVSLRCIILKLNLSTPYDANNTLNIKAYEVSLLMVKQLSELYLLTGQEATKNGGQEVSQNSQPGIINRA